MKLLKFAIGLLLGAILILVPFSAWQSTSTSEVQLLAVQVDGRKKPLDTVARETVTQIHGSPSYRTADGETLDSTRAFLSLWFNDRDWNAEPLVLVNYRPLKLAAGLNEEQKYFSFAELMQSDLPELFGQARQQQAAGGTLGRSDREALTVADRMSLMLDTVANRGAVNLVPHPTDIKGAWTSLDRAADLYSSDSAVILERLFDAMETAYLERGTPAALNESALQLHEQLYQLSSKIYPSGRALSREVFFNRFHAFGKAWHVYAIAFLGMLAVTLLGLSNWYWLPMGAFAAGLGVQVYGFAMRIAIADRPPVTNMYESVVWVGFGLAGLAMAFELRTRARYYLLAAAPLAISALILADSLPAVLDASIQPLVPVLRDNFWLSIHVPTITLSYACFALAMGLGHIILGHYLFAPGQTRRLQTLSKLNYSVLQVGVLLLAAGIILGGIWAHFSWGRFWGWDPKETWAAIALLCYLAPLHGRFVGWVDRFGMAVASVVSFNAVLMAWYGVNFVLGQGLHSYGFGTGGSSWIATIVGVDLGFVALTALRYRRDRSLLASEPRVTRESNADPESVAIGAESAA